LRRHHRRQLTHKIGWLYQGLLRWLTELERVHHVVRRHVSGSQQRQVEVVFSQSQEGCEFVLRVVDEPMFRPW